MKIFYNVLLLLLLTCEYLHSQSPDPLSFFPHHQGDVWEYVNWWGNDPEQNIILKDTLGPDGKYYLETTMFGKMCIDTVSFEVRSNMWGGFTYNTLLFKLDADVGDVWIVDSNEYRVYQAVVVDVYQMYVFGYLVTVKEIDYVESTSGLLLDTYYIASGFGVIRQDVDIFPVHILRGAIINGIKYGTVDVKNEENIWLPRQFILYDNYPNPFNSTTTIRFAVKTSGTAAIKIFNILGKEVKSFQIHHTQPGEYEISWDGTDKNGVALPSGVYFSRLQINNFVAVKKMSLLR